MVDLLYRMIYNVAQIHEELLRINDSSELFLSDKELHFVVMGLLGMGLLLVIYPLFLILSKHNVLTIAWIYVFTVMVVISFAIEIGQGFTGTGNMDMDDIRPGGVHADVLYLCRRAPGPDADLAVHFPQGLMEGPVLLTGLKNGRKTTEKQFSEASDRFFMHWDRSPRHGSWNIHRCSRCLQRPPRGGQASRAYPHRAGQGSPHSSGNVL